MIHYLVTRPHAYTLADYLETWARELKFALRTTVRIHHYEDLPSIGPLDAGTYIFSDLERLTDAQLRLADHVAQRLLASGRCRVLNRPKDVLRRFELLSALHADGRNRFAVYRADGRPTPKRFPVFVRREDDHEGATTLIDSQGELDAALDAIGSLQHHIVVEFCDVRDAAGIVRKYSAMRIGDEVIARHVLFSEKWMLKKVDRLDQAFIDEENAYVDANPHRDCIRAIFDTARVDYGRIDYAVVDGAVQTWEINTNPVVLPTPERIDPRRIGNQAISSRAIMKALQAIGQDVVGEPIDPAIPATMIDDLSLNRHQRMTHQARNACRAVIGWRHMAALRWHLMRFCDWLGGGTILR